VSRTDVAYLQSLGFDIFPCHPDKRPRTPGDWREPRKYEWRDDDLIGVAVPSNCVVLDIDDVEVFEATGFEVSPSVYSPTRREGGIHIYYRIDRPADQVTEGHTLGYDTRVGGKGYVIAWNPSDWKAVSEWGAAPDWLYSNHRGRREAASTQAQPAALGTRADILSFLGRLALQGNLTAKDYEGLLVSRLASGSIISLDPKRPWTAADMRTLATEASKWPPAKTGNLFLRPQRVIATLSLPSGLTGMTADTLLGLSLPPLKWRVDHLLPEGLGLLAAPPKTGKSVLAYQLAVEIALGGSVFDIAVASGPVLYYALEDGQRRSQSRVASMVGDRRQGLERLHLRWEAPRLGGALEDEINAWLGHNPDALVIIDVLAKVRPNGATQSKNLNAYDTDYDALSTLQLVAKMNPGSTILVVTHDRKQGSEDWMTRVTGTRGVTGAADFVIFLNRKRGENGGTFLVAGRDVEDTPVELKFNVTGWTKADMQFRLENVHETRQLLYAWLMDNGPAQPLEIAKGCGLSHDVVKHRLIDMRKDGMLMRSDAGYNVSTADD
jgi:hypothetical protein